MTMYCLSDNTTCSYCISNINRDVSCSTLNRYYTGSISVELDFEQPVSVRVDACDDLYPEACVHQSEWSNYTIPSGGKYFSFTAPDFAFVICLINYGLMLGTHACSPGHKFPKQPLTSRQSAQRRILKRMRFKVYIGLHLRVTYKVRHVVFLSYRKQRCLSIHL